MALLGCLPARCEAQDQVVATSAREASRADWPDVIAAYITDRAKKQIALSVIEDLKDKLKDYTIMSRLFPETAAFLTQMGPSWISDEGADRIRRKLIADFTQLPVVIIGLEPGVGAKEGHTDKTPLKYRKPEVALAYVLYAGMLEVHTHDRDFSHFTTGARKAIGELVAALDADKDQHGFNREQMAEAKRYFELFKIVVDQMDIVAKGAKGDQEREDLIRSLSSKELFRDADLARTALDLYIEKAYDCMRAATDALSREVGSSPEAPVAREGKPGSPSPVNQEQVKSIIFLCETTFEIYEYITRRDYRNAALSAILLARKTGVLTDKRWGRWIHMAGSYSSAETAQEKYDFLDSITDPISDYLNKRNAVAWEPYLGINAYLGGRYAYEDVRHSDHSDAVIGLTAPVGLELGCGTGWAWMPHVGVLGFPIDVGKPATARLRSSDVGGDTIEDQGTTWEEIVSPGAYLVFAISRRYPISLGVGAQYTPRIEIDGNPGSSWQYGVILGIDVPLLRLW
jgi:hypothetical protein